MDLSSGAIGIIVLLLCLVLGGIAVGVYYTVRHYHHTVSVAPQKVPHINQAMDCAHTGGCQTPDGVHVKAPKVVKVTDTSCATTYNGKYWHHSVSAHSVDSRLPGVSIGIDTFELKGTGVSVYFNGWHHEADTVGSNYTLHLEVSRVVVTASTGATLAGATMHHVNKIMSGTSDWAWVSNNTVTLSSRDNAADIVRINDGGTISDRAAISMPVRQTCGNVLQVTMNSAPTA
jgi:hypothetical protein